MARDHHIVQKMNTAGPMRTAVYVVVALVSLGGGGWGLFDYGRYRAGFDSEAALQQLSSLENRIRAYSIETQDLREKIAILESGKEIDKAAYVVVEGSLKGLQDEVHELKQQLSFYQGIVSPADTSKGVRVLSFKFDTQPEARAFRYKLILMQGPKRARQVSGRINVTVNGMLAGKDKTLKLSDLLVSGATVDNYKFKYFQEFQGVVSLPEGFVVTDVLIRLTPEGKSPKVVEEHFSWSMLVN